MIGISLNGTDRPWMSCVFTDESDDRWIANVRIDQDSLKLANGVLAQPLKTRLVFNEASFIGTTMEVSLDGDVVVMTVVGGTGHLGYNRKALHMGRNITLQSVAQELLRGNNEQLSGRSNARFLRNRVDAYQIFSNVRTGSQLGGMCKLHGGRWRVEQDGSIGVFNADTWDTIEPDSKEWTRHRTVGGDGRVVYTFTTLNQAVRPGMLDGELMRYMMLSWESGLYTLTLAPYDFTLAIQNVLMPKAQLDARLSRSYAATINTQNGDGSFDLTPDDASIRGDGLRSVPYRTGATGITLTDVEQGTRCLIQFEDGDPSRPFVSSFMKEQARRFMFTLGPPDTSTPIPRDDLVQAEFNRHRDFINGFVDFVNNHLTNEFAIHIHPHSMGPTSPTTTVPTTEQPMDPVEDTASNHGRID